MNVPTLTASFRKRFSGGPEIVADNLWLDGGVTVLFGESGSGKTTVLRCLAGLERPDAGRIAFNGDVWFDHVARTFLPPRKRNVGFVPQDYALFPHLTVAGNVGYGLNELPAADRAARVAETLHWLGLDGLDARLPRELSGGQQQRVALARAVVRHPKLLLMDEPLSALDSPTRHRLRGELRALLRQLKIPTLIVTHDRLEAAALGDQLVVMVEGAILQSGSVADVFNRPASLAVAHAVGTDTVLTCAVLGQADGLASLGAGSAHLTAMADTLPPTATTVHVCIRAEDVILARAKDADASARNQLPGIVRTLHHEGPLVRVELDCGFPLKALLTRQSCAELGLQEGGRVVALIKAPHIHIISNVEG